MKKNKYIIIIFQTLSKKHKCTIGIVWLVGDLWPGNARESQNKHAYGKEEKLERVGPNPDRPSTD